MLLTIHIVRKNLLKIYSFSFEERMSLNDAVYNNSIRLPITSDHDSHTNLPVWNNNDLQDVRTEPSRSGGRRPVHDELTTLTDVL